MKGYYKEYSIMTKSIISLYNLRFKVITVYVIGLLATLLIGIPFSSESFNLGFFIAVIQTILMAILDYTIQGRQVLFSLKAAEIEKRIYKIQGDNLTSKGLFNHYFDKCWMNKPFCKDKDLEICLQNRKWHFMFTRGILYLVIILVIVLLAIIMNLGIFEIDLIFI